MAKLIVENTNKETPVSVRIYRVAGTSTVTFPATFTLTDPAGASAAIGLAVAPDIVPPPSGWGENYGENYGAPL